MATTKPRFVVTCNPSTHEVIKRLADIQGRSRGAVVAELLDEVAPALARTVALLEAAASAPGQVKAGLRAAVETAHDQLLAVAGDGIAQMDMLISAISNTGDQADFLAPDASANPHVVTRGSGIKHDSEKSGGAVLRKGSRTGLSGPKAQKTYGSFVESFAREEKGV